MATYTSNYAWTKPEGSDPVDITVLNNNLDSQDNIVHNAYMQFAPVFSTASTYAVDDVVLYTNNLYKCITAVTVAGAWDSTKWTQVKVSDICGGGGGGGGTTNYNQLTNKPQINSVELSGNKTSAQLGLMASDGVVANPTGQTTSTLTALKVGGTKYAVGGGSGTSDYTDLTNKPSINGVTLLGNKTTSDLGITASGVGAIPNTDKGANGGVAELDANGKVPSSQLPSYVDDVLSYSSQSAFPATGETGKIYIAEDTNKTYRWSGSAYAEISASLALGETSSTAYRGDRGKTAYDHSQTTGNPHGTTAADVGLGNVPNVATDDQTPTFTTASSRNNLVSGEKLSVIMGKISKFFNDLKTVAFSGSYKDLSNKPQFDTMPAASADYLGDIVQYMGASITGSYQHGYFYECTTDGSTYSWVQTNVQPSSGSGGHTIVNGAGASMTQRDALQFTGGLSVSDDSTNERTVVSDDYEIILWEDWQTIVANHEEDLHPDAIITGAPGADGDISVELMTKLWENTNPTSAFASQSVTLSSSDYDLLLFVCDIYANTNHYVSDVTPKGKGAYISYVRYDNGASPRTRAITRTDDTHYNIGDALVNGTTNNNHLIPIAIYGIKTTASVKVSAIAENVSTSADKCMLSDGVTSVEDAISNKHYGIAVSLLGYTSSSNYFTCPADGVVHLSCANSSSSVYTGLACVDFGNNNMATSFGVGSGALITTVPVIKGQRLFVLTNATNPFCNYYPIEY